MQIHYKGLIISLLASLLLIVSNTAIAQKPFQAEFAFQKVDRHEATSVKFQGNTGTCWVYGTLSLIESELLRMEKGSHNLSEMFVVWHNYPDRTKDYVRYHGHKKFSAGAEGWDVFNVIERYGIVPERIYPVKNPAAFYADHREMDAVLKGMADSIAKQEAPLSNVWLQGFKHVLNTYLGALPKEFQAAGKIHTPQSYAEYLGIKPENYITIGSFTHHPFYEKFIFEGPDNWSQGSIYNVPLNELIYIMHHAIDKGYTFTWVSDVSNKGFSHGHGLAVLPDVELKYQPESLRNAWSNIEKDKRRHLMYSKRQPVPEKKVTQKMRQKSFDNHLTTEDHLMHICGRAYDEYDKPYFIVKNSWGRGTPYDGYIYASQPFVKMYTLSIALHKDAVPRKIMKQLQAK